MLALDLTICLALIYIRTLTYVVYNKGNVSQHCSGDIGQANLYVILGNIESRTSFLANSIQQQ